MIVKRKLIVERPNYELEFIREAKNSTSEPRLYIEGVYMQHSEKNKNRRKYLQEEMDTEVGRYIKESIETGSAVGELNHCVPATYDILTESGWKSLKDIKEDEIVATLSSDNKIQYNKIDEKIQNEFSGEMYRFYGRNINKIVTSNHKFYLKDRYNEYSFVSAEEIVNNRKKYNKHSIPKSGEWIGQDIPNWTLIGIDSPKLGNYNNDISKSIDIDTETFMSFMGLWLAEGHLDKNRYSVYITQVKEKNINPIIKMLSKFPKELEWKYSNTDGKYTFYLNDKRLWSYLLPLGNCYNKYIPVELKQLSSKYLNKLFHWFNVGDGRFNLINGKYKRQNVFSTSFKLISDLQEILFKFGKGGNIHEITDYDDIIIKDRVIKGENKSPLYELNVSTTDGIYLDERFLNIEKINYSGLIGCVSVKNHNWYCRDHSGKTYWTGNSSKPEIDLDRVCHRIVSLVPENNYYIGKSMVTSSTPSGKILEGLIEDGVRIGMSTKALGQIDESSDDSNTVRNFMLIGVDAVHDPSCTSAFVNGILENKEFIIDTKGHVAEAAYEVFEKQLSKYPSVYRSQINEHVENAITRFLNSL